MIVNKTLKKMFNKHLPSKLLWNEVKLLQNSLIHHSNQICKQAFNNFITEKTLNLLNESTLVLMVRLISRKGNLNFNNIFFLQKAEF